MLVVHVLVAHMAVMCAHLLHAPWWHIRGSSTCIIICHRYDDSTTAPIGDPSMARLP